MLYILLLDFFYIIIKYVLYKIYRVFACTIEYPYHTVWRPDKIIVVGRDREAVNLPLRSHTCDSKYVLILLVF